MQELEMFLHLVLGFRMLSFVDPLRDVEDKDESHSEDDAGYGRNTFGEEVNNRRREQDEMHRRQTERDLDAANLDVGRHLPAALAGELEAQHKHRQAVKREAPN